MEKFTPPRLEIVRFDAEDVIAASFPVISLRVNDIAEGTWFTILNGEGAKGFSDWNDYGDHSNYDSDTMTLNHFSGGDWYNDGAPGGSNVGNSSNSAHTSLTYIWYGSGYGAGNVTFMTQNQSWGYYLSNGISLPRSQ